MNDDQNLNPTTPTQDPTPTSVPPVDTNATVSPATVDAMNVAPEPIKLDEFGVPASDTPVTAPEPVTEAVVSTPATEPTTLPVAPELPQMPEQVVAPAEVTPVASTPVAQGEDLPLAFAGMPASTTAEPAMTEANPYPAPVVNDPSNVPPAPLPASEPEQPKKKEFSIKKLVGIVSIIAVIGAALGGAWYAYLNYAGEDARIAAVQSKVKDKDQDSCSGCVNGGWLVWRNGQCKVTGICGNDNENKNTQNPNAPETTTNSADCANSSGIWCDSVDSNGKPYKFCISSSSTKGCNAVAVEKGFTITYGANWSMPNKDGSCAGSNSNPCNCGGTKVCFDKTGVCDSADAVTKNYTEGEKIAGVTYYNTYGLCALAGSYDANGKFYPKGEDYSAGYTCTDTGCSTTSPECITVKYTCSGAATASCTDKSEKYINGSMTTQVSQNFAGKCGTVEQLDVMCGGKYITSRSRTNPPCDTTNNQTTNETTPTLVCNGLTKDKADSAISIGTKVTFTCDGSVAPAGATSLTYKFRYAVNRGAWVTLTNKTSTTAELTPNSCGAYAVQCQVCGTINGSLVCKPDWERAR